LALMEQNQALLPEDLLYKSGLDRIEEAVVSSHFMHRFCNDSGLESYDLSEFETRSRYISLTAVFDILLPTLLSASREFCHARLAEIKARARQNYTEYGLSSPGDVEAADFMAEVMFDRNYSKDAARHCSRQLLSSQIAQRIQAGLPIRMVIPALPFKISSPLKSRGARPDLAEVNFLLLLYEVALTVELLYKEARPDIPGRLAEFAVVSDGSRFSALVGESESVVRDYRERILRWSEWLGIADFVRVYDYKALLSERLLPQVQQQKLRISQAAVADYAQVMWPLFDPLRAAASLRLAARIEPDPERENPEGRFGALLKSLVYTIQYKSLRREGRPALWEHRRLYRELTGHIFEPYVAISSEEIPGVLQEIEAGGVLSDSAKEYLRQSMLKEAWEATILYLAEIKSDRELQEEPISSCLPAHIRWTIHAKRGQIAIAVPTALGLSVQAWAGAAVFKRVKRGKIKLCTLPVLALEGAKAIPVRVQDSEGVLGLGDQPLFYLYPDIGYPDVGQPDRGRQDITAFLAALVTSLTRRKVT